MNNRLLLGSLVVLAALSGVVVVEAEQNYAAVTAGDPSTATVGSATATDDGVQIEVVVVNEMPEPLKVQYVRIVLHRPNATDAASIPYKGARSVAPGESTLTMTVPERQLSGNVSAWERVHIDGYVAVAVYNDHRFQVSIKERKVTL
ncbi:MULTISPECIES: hypothetical protein [Halolamina]|nr:MULTISPECIES: hypothetical protein [Halolamina]NHX37964.1 hypothetical protein [Halolamina sp. R1-12]